MCIGNTGNVFHIQLQYVDKSGQYKNGANIDYEMVEACE